MQFESRPYRTDDGNFLMFRWDTAKNNFLTEKEGRPVFDEVLIMTILSPGQQKSTVDKEVIRKTGDKEKKDDNSFMRYGRQIEEFLSKEQAGGRHGTPVEHWKEIDLGQAATLRALNVFTVEALAELSDTGLQAIGMEGRKLQKKAKDYLEATKDSAAVMNALKEEQQKNVELNARLEQLQERLEALEDKPEEKPKRKRKKA